MIRKFTYTGMFISLIYLFCGCAKKDKVTPVVDLTLDATTIHLAANGITDVHITSGNGDYTVVSSNSEVVQATLSGDVVTVEAKTTAEAAEAVIIVTDAQFKRAVVNVQISNLVPLRVDETALAFHAMQQQGKIAIHGYAPYQVSMDNELIANVKIKQDTLFITGKRNGSATIQIEDAKGRQTAVALTIDGPEYALNLSDQYFGYANFRDIAVVDASVKSCKQVTFELVCKLNGYRGLQTFMGLEGNLIIRGKNDDYRDTHPIQIAGLGDKVMLESTHSFNLNEWMSIALVVDCNEQDIGSKYKLYINGVQDELVVQRQEQTHSTVNLASSNDGDRFEIGRAFGQDWRVLRGMVSEARVWTVARTAQQIKENICALAEEKPNGLLARWDFSAGMETNYIQDTNGGQYETNLILANAKHNGSYTPTMVPLDAFVAKGCPASN